MPENIDRESIANPTLTVRKAARSLRMLSLARIVYRGAGLLKLRTLERKCDKAGRQLDGQPVLERIPALCTLVKTYDIILDRRRILVGDPLPRGGGQKQIARTLDLEPLSLDPEQGAPVPPMPEPPTSVD